MKQPISATSLLVGVVTATAFFMMVTLSHLIPVDPYRKSRLAVELSAVSDHYAQLDETERIVYDRLAEGIPKGEMVFTFSNMPFTAYEEACDRAVAAFIADHPECFWLRNGYQSAGINSLLFYRGYLKLELNAHAFWKELSDPQELVNQLYSKVDEVAKLARQYNDEYEQVKFVHDYLVDNTLYDNDTLLNTKLPQPDADSDYIYTAYGCLLEGKAVCAGYARAFQMILYELGIPCSYETGEGNGVPHAWNCVTLDGEQYYVDVTWDDADRADGNDRRYTYFLVTSADFEQNHAASPKFTQPLCTATANNFFVREGYFVEQYSHAAVDRVLAGQSENPVMFVRFSSAEELQKLTGDLRAGKWSGIKTLKTFKCTFSTDERYNIVTFYKKTAADS